jgi:Xaa-Pro aminopeptidase
VRYFTGYSCWLDSLFKAHMMWPGDSSRLLSPSYAFVCLSGGRALVVSASLAVNAANLGDVHLHCYGNPGVDFTLQSEWPSQVEQRFLDLFQYCSGNTTALQGLVSALTEYGLSEASIGIELDGVPKEVTAEIFQSLPKARWRDCTNLLRLIRAVKTAEEIRLLASAAEIAENAAMGSLELARAGARSEAVVQHFKAHIAQCGASFDHFSFSLNGLGICESLQRPFQPEDVLFVDYGCIYSSYFSDTGTTVAFTDLDLEMMRRYGALQAATAAGVGAMRPGVKASVIQREMRDALADHGVSACFPHGHGMGLELRDYPILVPATGLPIRDDCIEVDSDLAMEPGMVVNLETPLFLPTAGALQIEKTYVITEDGNRDLCSQDRTKPYVAAD